MPSAGRTANRMRIRGFIVSVFWINPTQRENPMNESEERPPKPYNPGHDAARLVELVESGELRSQGAWISLDRADQAITLQAAVPGSGGGLKMS